MRRKIAVVLCMIGLAAGAPAAGLDEAERLYRAGNMLEAARVARAVGSADAFALAAKATLVDALYLAPAQERGVLLHRAADDADRALHPDHVDAMLRLAVTLGHIAEQEDLVSAHLKGYGHQGRELLQRALALEPDDPWTNGLLGIWHLQVVHHGGEMLAKSLYRASEAEGRRLCERALELEPGATSIRFGCARSLLDLDPEKHRDEALVDLRQVVSSPAEDFAGRLLRQEAWAEIRKIRQMAAG